VPRECVGDADPGPHEQNLADVGRRYADVVGEAEVLDWLRARPPVAGPAA
jgi:hypothetical protein